MSKSSIRYLLVLVVTVAFSGSVSAGESGFGSRLAGFFHRSSTDLQSYECDECGQFHGADVQCIERVPVSECVKGKKKVYDCQVRYEYVSIPEIRYRWKKMWVTKEIPCDGCVPVCKSQDGQHCFGAERWDESGQQCCSKLHCRHIDQKSEKTTCKYCDCEPGETTIKVRYKTCVKVPYTVYRQVKREVCVKQPRYEKVQVPIVRHECRSANSQCSLCEGAGCRSCTQ